MESGCCWPRRGVSVGWLKGDRVGQAYDARQLQRPEEAAKSGSHCHVMFANHYLELYAQGTPIDDTHLYVVMGTSTSGEQKEACQN